jgi:hypothetical protein
MFELLANVRKGSLMRSASYRDTLRLRPHAFIRFNLQFAPPSFGFYCAEGQLSRHGRCGKANCRSWHAHCSLTSSKEGDWS